MTNIKHGDRVRDGIGGEKRLLVGREGQTFGIASPIGLARKLGGESVKSFAGSGVEHVDFVAIRERYKEKRVIVGKYQRCGMRACGEGLGGLLQGNDAAEAPGAEIEFGHSKS